MPSGGRVGVDTVGALPGLATVLPPGRAGSLPAAAAWGMARVAASEVPYSKWSGIDVDGTAPSTFSGGSVAIGGLAGGRVQDGVVLAPLLLPAAPPLATASDAAVPTQDGRIIITGGLGGKTTFFMSHLLVL